MKDKAIAYDLGTSGIKASLYDQTGESIADSLVTYDTVYSGKTFQEQDPRAWWNGVVVCTHKLLEKTRADAGEIAALSISGHSLGAVPISKDGRILTERTPLWSDLRANAQADRFFERMDYQSWYMTTGNGFPRECYSIFKIMWCKENQPDVYADAYRFLGSKDLCNYFLTGRMCTDPSYASGSGVYSLKDGNYSEDLIAASGIDREKLPEIIGSKEVVGYLTREAASVLGLNEGVLVVCGGVDNACMALGAKGTENNRAYMSLGSSAWIAVVSDRPILDFEHKPFVFAHVLPGMFASATSIFAAGTCMRWARENLCPDLVLQEKAGTLRDAYAAMDEWILRSPVGANRLVFNPSLAGGAMIEESPHICGGFVGLNASHARQDLLRAVMEGITYNLRYALEILQSYGKKLDQILVVGGGSKSAVWRQMFADVMHAPIVKTSVDQNAASLGAAALAFVGAGLWKDYSRIDQVHRVESALTPDVARSALYDPMYEAFRKVAHHMSEIGLMLDSL